MRFYHRVNHLSTIALSLVFEPEAGVTPETRVVSEQAIPLETVLLSKLLFKSQVRI